MNLNTPRGPMSSSIHRPKYLPLQASVLLHLPTAFVQDCTCSNVIFMACTLICTILEQCGTKAFGFGTLHVRRMVLFDVTCQIATGFYCFVFLKDLPDKGISPPTCFFFVFMLLGNQTSIRPT